MKKHYIFLQIALFSAVFFLFLLPMLCRTSAPDDIFCNWSFPKEQLTAALLSGLFLYACHRITAAPAQEYKIRGSWKNAGIALLSLCALMIVAGALQWAGSRFLPQAKNVAVVRLPQDVPAFFFCVLTFLSAASFEELLFRAFVPLCLKEILINAAITRQKALTERTKKAAMLSAITVSGILFALSHRYLGALAVLNAIFAHGILTACLLRTKSLAFPSLAHFLYNMVNLVILSGCK